MMYGCSQALPALSLVRYRFKKILANWRQFRTEQHRWFSIADTRAELAVYRSDTQR